MQGGGLRPVVVETAGIGQGDAAVVPHVDVSLYVMTPEYGAASQLEKIDMLDFADFVAINKFDRKGAEDALRDVRKQYQRNRQLFSKPTEEMPVFGTQASRFNDDGVTALYQAIAPKLAAHGFKPAPGRLPAIATQGLDEQERDRPARARALPRRDRRRGARLQEARLRAVPARARAAAASPRRRSHARAPTPDRLPRWISTLIAARDAALDPRSKKLLEMWPAMQKAYSGDEYVVKIRDREVRTKLTHKTPLRHARSARSTCRATRTTASS